MSKLSEIQLLKRYKLSKSVSEISTLLMALTLCLLAGPISFMSMCYLSVQKYLQNLPIQTVSGQTLSSSRNFLDACMKDYFIPLTVILLSLMVVACILVCLREHYRNLITYSMGNQCVRKEYQDELGTHVALYLQVDSPWRALGLHGENSAPFYLKKRANDTAGVIPPIRPVTRNITSGDKDALIKKEHKHSENNR